MSLALKIAKTANVKHKAVKQELFTELCQTVFPLKEITTSQEHKAALRVIESVSQEIEAQAHPDLHNYGHALACLIEEYETKSFSNPTVKGIELLQFLMDQHGLNQSSFLQDIGPQPIVSEILNQKRKLTRDHIERLSKRFNISPAAFFEE